MWKHVLQMLTGQGEEDPTFLLEADPLIIVTTTEEIHYPGRSTVEFTPDSPWSLTGHAVADQTEDGRLPTLTVTGRIKSPNSLDIRVRSRGGLTFMGTDEHGEPAIWYLGTDADEFLFQHKASLQPARRNSLDEHFLSQEEDDHDGQDD